MDPLNTFTNDVHLREKVQDYLLEYLDMFALERLYAKDDVSGIADAKIVIEGAFNQLVIEYGPKHKAPNTVNASR